MRRVLVPPARVLVRMPAWLGDCAMSEPIVRALCERYARVGVAEHVTLAGSERFAEVFGWRRAGAPRFIPLERGANPDARAWRGHDVALLLDGSWRSAWAAARAGIPERIGFGSGGRANLLTAAVMPALERGSSALGSGVCGAFPRRLPRPFGSACIELCALAGLEVRDRTPRIDTDAATHARVAVRFAAVGIARAKSCVLIHAGARPNSAKGVPPETWAFVARALRQRSALPIVLTCAPGEEASARAVHRLAAETILLDAPPLDVAELAAAHAFAALALTSDSGPRHLAHAVSRTPTVVLFGPTDPRHTADHSDSVLGVRVELPCSPCHREVCPLSGADHHACMRRIDPAVVVERAFELLAR